VRAFGSTGYLLGNARLEVRLVYTVFLLLVSLGMGTMAVVQIGQYGLAPSAIAIAVRGGERAGAMVFEKTFRELIELTHFHAFSMAVVYLILAHLMIATRAPGWVKRWTIVLGFAGLTGDIVGLWLVRYVSPRFAWFELAAWAAEWPSFLAFVIFPVWDMWILGPVSREDE
jgi:hypothetical protein